MIANKIINTYNIQEAKNEKIKINNILERKQTFNVNLSLIEFKKENTIQNTNSKAYSRRNRQSRKKGEKINFIWIIYVHIGMKNQTKKHLKQPSQYHTQL